MKIAKLKAIAKKKQLRRPNELERAIETIRKLGVHSTTNEKFQVFVSAETVVVKSASNPRSASQSGLRGKLVRSKSMPAMSAPQYQALYEGMERIVSASRLDTEKAISTLGHQRSNADIDYFSEVKKRALSLNK